MGGQQSQPVHVTFHRALYGGEEVKYGGEEVKYGGARGDDVASSLHNIRKVTDPDSSTLIKGTEKFIRDIAKLLAHELKQDNINPDESNLDDLLNKILKAIPDPIENKYGIPQASIDSFALKLKKTINEFGKGTQYITGNSTEQILDEVHRVLETFGTSLRDQFSHLKVILEDNLNTMNTVRQTLKNTYAQMVNAIDKSDDNKVKMKVDQLNNFANELENELDKYIALLSKQLNVHIKHTDDNIDQSYKAYEKAKNKIDLIHADKKYNDRYNKKGALAMLGFKAPVIAAHNIRDALTKVGMSINDFVKTTSLVDLTIKLNQLGADLEKDEAYYKAVETLMKNFASEEVRSQLQNEVRGKGEKSKYEKKVESRERLKKIFVKQFVIVLNKHLKDAMDALDIIHKKFGSKIPTSELMERFIFLLTNTIDIRNTDLYYALMGFGDVRQSKELRDIYISTLRSTSSVISDIINSGKYGNAKDAFSKLKSAYESIVTLIENTVSEIKSKPSVYGPKRIYGEGDKVKGAEEVKYGGEEVKYGGEEVACGGEEVCCGGIDEGCEYVKGAEEVTYGGCGCRSISGGYDRVAAKSDLGGFYNTIPPVGKAAVDYGEIVNTFKYYYKTSKLMDFLGYTKNELRQYKEKFEKTLGSNVSGQILKLSNEMELKLKEAERDFNKENWSFKNDPLNDATTFKQDIDDYATYIKTFIESSYKVRIKFYQTIECLEIYLRSFTENVVVGVDDFKDIKAMFDNVEYVRDWFAGQSGDSLAKCFEQHHAVVDGQTPAFVPSDPVKNVDGIGTGSHYYMSSGLGVVDTIGMPFTPLNLGNTSGTPDTMANIINRSKCQAAFKGVYDTLYNWLGFKNLLNLFFNTVKRIGNTEFLKEIKMSPTEVYNNLIQYILYSSFSVGFHNPDPKSGKPVDHISLALGNGANFTVSYANTTDISTIYDFRTVPTWNPLTPPSAAALLAAGPGVIPPYTPTNPSDYWQNPSISTSTHVPVERNTQISRTYLAHKYAFVMTGVPLLAGGFNDDKNKKDALFKNLMGMYKEDNYLFARSIKAMVGKILSAVGIFNLLEHPQQGLKNYETIRRILGGTELPKVEPRALELYVRIPLLIKFYIDLFNLDPSDTNSYAPSTSLPDARSLGTIPEYGSEFDTLIRYSMEKLKYGVKDRFSEQDMIFFVKECNGLYSKHANSDDPVSSVIKSLISDINRRYGILLKREKEAYAKDIYGYDNDPRNTPFSNSITDIGKLSDKALFLDYPILEDEGDIVTPHTMTSPSDTYQILEGKVKPKISVQDLGIEQWQYELIRDFRMRLTQLTTGKLSGDWSHGGERSLYSSMVGEYSFKPSLDRAREELIKLNNNDDKFRVVVNLLQNLVDFQQVDTPQHIIFHEVVLVGMDVLRRIETSLRDFIVKFFSDGFHGIPRVGTTRGPTGLISKAGAQFTSYPGNNLDSGYGTAKQIGNVVNLLFKQFVDFEDLVSISFTKSGVSLGYQPLWNEIEKMTGMVKATLTKCRTILTRDVLGTYEDELYRLIDDIERIFKTPKQIPNYDFSVTNESRQWPSLVDLSQFLSTMFKDCYFSRLNATTDKSRGSLFYLFHALTTAIGNVDGMFATLNGPTLLPIMDKNALDMNTYVPLPDVLAFDNDLFKNNYNVEQTVPGGFKMLNVKNDNCLFGFYNAGFINEQSGMPKVGGSLFTQFNQLCGLILNRMFDQTTKKIYHKFVNAFNNVGATSVSIGSPNTRCINDLFPSDLTNNINVQDNNNIYPNENTLFYRSIAVFLNRVLNVTDKDGKRLQAMTFDDISLNMKEKMKAYNPIFAKMVTYLIKRATMIKDLLNALDNANYTATTANVDPRIDDEACVEVNSESSNMTVKGTLGNVGPTVDLNIGSGKLVNDFGFIYFRKPGTAAGVAVNNKTDLIIGITGAGGIDGLVSDLIGKNTLKTALRDIKNTDTNLNTSYFGAFIDNVLRVLFNLRGVLAEVQRELNDSPKYIELYDKFIDEYKSMNKSDVPLMLPSFSTLYLDNGSIQAGPDNTGITIGVTSTRMLANRYKGALALQPMHSPMEQEFKFLYGTREFFNSTAEVTPTNMPYLTKLVDIYNSYNKAYDTLDMKQMLDYVNSLRRLVRYVYDSDSIKYTMQNSLDLISSAPQRRFSYLLRSPHTVSEVVTLVESKDRTKVILKMLNDTISGTGNVLNKPVQDYTLDVLAAYNIVDMGIPPINVFAIMREIPFTHIYNYSYTFDTLLTHGTKLNNVISGKANVVIYSQPGADPNTQYVSNPNQLMKTLLLDPYIGIAEDNYTFHTLFRDIAYGIGQANFGRPKYIYEELAGKSLFMGASDGQLLGIPGSTTTGVALPGPDPKLIRYPSLDAAGVRDPNYSIDTMTDFMGAVGHIAPSSATLNNPTSRLDEYYLTWINKKGDKMRYDVRPGVKGYSQAESLALKQKGKLRFDTTLVRNLTFITNIWRYTQIVINQDLNVMSGVTVKGVPALDYRITQHNINN